MLKMHVSSDVVKMVDIEDKTRNHDAASRCYRILVEGSNPYMLMSPEFWDSGIGCRRFFRKRDNGGPK